MEKQLSEVEQSLLLRHSINPIINQTMVPGEGDWRGLQGTEKKVDDIYSINVCCCLCLLVGWLVRQRDCTKTTEHISTTLKRRTGFHPSMDPIIQMSLDPDKEIFFLTFCQDFTPTHRLLLTVKAQRATEGSARKIWAFEIEDDAFACLQEYI